MTNIWILMKKIELESKIYFGSRFIDLVGVQNLFWLKIFSQPISCPLSPFSFYRPPFSGPLSPFSFPLSPVPFHLSPFT
jgi:hypothetical protein